MGIEAARTGGRDVATASDTPGSTARSSSGSSRGGLAIAARADEVVTPLLLIVGESDPIVDPGFTVATYAAFGSPDKILTTCPGMLHEPFNEVGRGPLIDAVGRWIAARTGPARSAGEIEAIRKRLLWMRPHARYTAE